MTNNQTAVGLSKLIERKILVCPHCGQYLAQRGKSLVCGASHSFDVARQGYVNLAAHSHKVPSSKTASAKAVAAKTAATAATATAAAAEVPSVKVDDAGACYSADFVQARRAAIERGFFEALVSTIAALLKKYCGKGSLSILDAGCGEGSFFDLLAKQLLASGFANPICLGIDLAVPGIRYAASHFRDHAWCVADLARIPCKANSLDVVLNILSPANYLEFSRILKPDGILIKVVPTTSHLCEMRHFLRGETAFSNTRVVEHFGASVKMLELLLVESCVPCGNEGAERLFHMTPLSWHATQAQYQEFVLNPPENLTVSFEILVAQIAKKESPF